MDLNRSIQTIFLFIFFSAGVSVGIIAICAFFCPQNFRGKDKTGFPAMIAFFADFFREEIQITVIRTVSFFVLSAVILGFVFFHYGHKFFLSSKAYTEQFYRELYNKVPYPYFIYKHDETTIILKSNTESFNLEIKPMYYYPKDVKKAVHEIVVDLPGVADEDIITDENPITALVPGQEISTPAPPTVTPTQSGPSPEEHAADKKKQEELRSAQDMYTAATKYWKEGDYQEAVKLLKLSADLYKQNLGEKHPDSVKARAVYEKALSSLKQMEAAKFRLNPNTVVFT